MGSWRVGAGGERAGCSAWDHRGVLAEVVESVPLRLRVLARLEGTRAWIRRGWPRIPRPGEAVGSWYLFDFFATDPERAGVLPRHVAAVAGARGIEYLYLIHRPGDPVAAAVRSDRPRLSAPVIPYRLLARRRSGIRRGSSARTSTCATSDTAASRPPAP